MTGAIRRAWSPRIARAFVGTYLALLTVGGGLLALGQLSLGNQITHVERTVELCSTKVSCRHLLHELVASVSPKERKLIIRRFAGPAPAVAEQPTAPVPRWRTRAKHRSPTPRRPRPSTTTSPAATEIPAAAAPAPTPAVPVPGPPAVTTPSREGPLGLPCPALPAVQRLVCH